LDKGEGIETTKGEKKPKRVHAEKARAFSTGRKGKGGGTRQTDRGKKSKPSEKVKADLEERGQVKSRKRGGKGGRN